MKRQQQNIDVGIIFKCRQVFLKGKHHSSVTKVPQGRVWGTGLYFQQITGANTGSRVTILQVCHPRTDTQQSQEAMNFLQHRSVCLILNFHANASFSKVSVLFISKCFKILLFEIIIFRMTKLEAFCHTNLLLF